MIIHLNLLQEERVVAAARARDPVRLAIQCAALLLILGGASGAVFMSLGLAAKGERARKDQQLAALEPEQKKALADLAELKALGEKRNTIDQFRRRRFLFATQLNAIKDSIPPNMELTKASFERKTAKMPNPVFQEKGPIDPVTQKKILPEITQKQCWLTLEGYVRGENARQAVEQLISRLNPPETIAGIVSGADVPPLPLTQFLDKAELKNFNKKIVRPPPGTVGEDVEVGQFEIICFYNLSKKPTP